MGDDAEAAYRRSTTSAGASQCPWRPGAVASGRGRPCAEEDDYGGVPSVSPHGAALHESRPPCPPSSPTLVPELRRTSSTSCLAAGVPWGFTPTCSSGQGW